jgi:hypothetical protein
VLGAIREVDDVELAEVEAAVGSTSFKRGRSYARANRVLRIEWDPGTETLTGSVVGQGVLYDTAAFFTSNGDSSLVLEDGECTCPVGYNCKHVAALVIAASDGRGGDRTRSRQRLPLRERPRQRVATPVRPPSWEQPLRALIDAPAARAATGNPLAIELTLHAAGISDRSQPRLMAKLMRAGARGGWVNGSLSWNGLDSWHVQSGEYRPDHLALVRELYAIHRARDGRAYYYSSGADKALDLSDCDSVQLWSLLDEADRIGLKLIHAHPGLGEVRCHQRGELLIDVTQQGDRGSLVSAVLQVDGEDAEDLEPLLFLGSSGHGVVCAERGSDGAVAGPERRRLALVRLLKPAPAPLRGMILSSEWLAIPAGELQRFAEELCPALRHIATVVSSDGSFTPPEISEPTLVLRASYGDGHHVEVGWEWSYEVGAATRHTAFLSNGEGPGFRDLDAERAILAAADFTGTGLERFGLLDCTGQPTDVHAISPTGIDRMRLTTEMLPRVEERPDVVVAVLGEPADYRDVSDSLTIGVSTADIAGERDWFDLGVTISFEGRELPFAGVFVALAGGESHMLLDDGAHFSLLEPRLQSLRQLIEEARALSDSQSAPLRISRYQAGLWAELAALGVVTEQAQAWQRQVGALLELDVIATHDPPAALQAQLRPPPTRGVRLAGIAAGARARRDPRRRHGARQDAADTRDDLPRTRRRPGCWPLPGRRSDERRVGLGGRGEPFFPRAQGRCDHRHAGALRAHDRGGRGRRRGGHDVHAVPARGGRLPHGGLGGADPRRGTVRQEPPGQDLPLRPRAGRSLQAGDNGNANGEQPDGAVVAAVDHRARPVS